MQSILKFVFSSFSPCIIFIFYILLFSALGYIYIIMSALFLSYIIHFIIHILSNLICNFYIIVDIHNKLFNKKAIYYNFD